MHELNKWQEKVVKNIDLIAHMEHIEYEFQGS